MPSERRRAPVARHMVCSATPGSEDVGPNRKSRFESFILPASKREIILAESTRTADTEGEEDGEHKERRSRPWWLCGRRRLGSVYKILKNGGYRVSIVQNPTISLQDDAAATQRILATQDGPVILVGHSYGGAVITEAGTHPKVAALVYITAFAPDKGESVATLIKDPPPGAPVPPILPPQDGYLFLDKAKVRASFPADVDP